MKRHLKYLKYVLRHKWFVFIECCKLGIPIRGILHDWSKFRPSEWFPYADYFYGDERPAREIPRGALAGMGIFPYTREEVEEAFDIAWNLHQKRNDHHWQFWLLTPDNPRPNFSSQSHDGGASHSYIRRISDGEDAALIFSDFSVDWWSPNWDAVRQLEKDLLHVTVPLPMPYRCRREMLADWRGAGRALGNPDTRTWYINNRRKIKLHPDTRAWIEQQLGIESEENA